MPTLPASAAAADDGVLTDDAPTGEIPMLGAGATALEIDPRMVVGFQTFNWKTSAKNPKPLGRIQIQLAASLGGKVMVAELRTGKIDRELIVPVFKALRAARPDLAAKPVEKHPNGRKGPYDINTFGTYDRAIAGGTPEGEDVFTD